MDIITPIVAWSFRSAVLLCRGESRGGEGMPKRVLWLIIIFTILFIIGVNTGELGYLMNLGNTI
jgi:TM2 domain-containing membrane protein YozV